jgi:hypothetical protein
MEAASRKDPLRARIERRNNFISLKKKKQEAKFEQLTAVSVGFFGKKIFSIFPKQQFLENPLFREFLKIKHHLWHRRTINNEEQPSTLHSTGVSFPKYPH